MFLNLLRSTLRWVRGKFEFTADGQPVPPSIVKGAAEVAVVNYRAEMQRLGEGLSDRNNVLSWYQAMRQQIKGLVISEGALARGGWEQMRPADYRALEPIVEREFTYLRAFAEDVVSGKYGPIPSQNNRFLQRVAQYANAGRSTYENERVKAQSENLGGDTESKRLLGGSAHCDDCLSWAGLGWIPTERMLRDYPVGASKCRSACHCVIITRRKKVA